MFETLQAFPAGPPEVMPGVYAYAQTPKFCVL